MVEKLCKFNDETGLKLKESYGNGNKIVSESVQAYFDNRIIPKGCKPMSLDVSEWIISQIEQSKLGKYKKSSFLIDELDNNRYQVTFILIGPDIRIESKFYVTSDNYNYIDCSLDTWEYETSLDYELSITEFSMNRIYSSVLWKMNA